ncbi:MFS transporter [Amycolatopsis sp. NBC_01286]|uniref:MFS transporter n=1 Tax=Amycolatopsis sp. NBC_01286 TaxID=2903560 RepID=UPI002E12F0BF|nr:MFS transporter [Amycolatopsis sp. NBC_01286]
MTSLNRPCSEFEVAVSKGPASPATVAGVAAVCVAMLVDSMLYSVVVPVLPVYTADLGASSFAIGVLFASYAVGLVLATPLLAWYSNRYGRRRPILLGSAALAVTTVIYTAADTYALLLAARFLQGAAAAAVWTAGIALVADLVPRERVGRSMGTVMACMSAGLVLGPPVGGALAELGGHRAPFLVLAAITVTSGLAQLQLIAEPSRPGAPSPPVRRLLYDRGLRGTVIAVFAAASALSMLEPILPLELDALGAGPLVVGLAFGAATLANAATSPLIGIAADRWRRDCMIGAGLVACGGVLPGFAFADTAFAISAVLVTFAIVYGLVIVPALPELASVAERHSGRAYATVYAAFNVSYSLGMMLGPLVGGIAAAGSVDVALAATGGVLCVCGLLVLTQATCRPTAAPPSESVANPVVPGKESQ